MIKKLSSTGAYFAGNISGSSGFKPNLRDPYNQVQHATAGIVIGYRYGWLGYQYAKWREVEPQDDRLYDATCPIGRSLNGELTATLRDLFGLLCLRFSHPLSVYPW